MWTSTPRILTEECWELKSLHLEVAEAEEVDHLLLTELITMADFAQHAKQSKLDTSWLDVMGEFQQCGLNITPSQ